MYLAKFFHKAPAGDDRLLLLSVEGLVLMGVHLREKPAPRTGWPTFEPSAESESNEFLRVEFDTVREAIDAYRREAETLRGAGFVETRHTRHTLDDLDGDFTPKPDWQRALDEAVMAVLADPLDVQTERLAALRDTPAEAEPLALWLTAHRASALGQADAVTLLQRARDALLAVEEAGARSYDWSLPPGFVNGQVFELLARRHLFEGSDFDPAAALAAVDAALAAAPTDRRHALKVGIVCDHFPELRTDAFDAIYRRAEYAGLDAITGRDAYKAYARRREADARANRATWRWSTASEPASEEAVAVAERALGIRYPDDYRRFLAERGACSLFVRLPDADAVLDFAAPDRQLAMRDGFRAFVRRTGETAAEAFRDAYGVSFDHLVPIAEPRSASNLLLLHAEPGPLFGRCYVWNHDGSFELENEQPSFAAMLAMLLGGIVAKKRTALDLLDIFVEDEDDEEEDDDD